MTRISHRCCWLCLSRLPVAVCTCFQRWLVWKLRPSLQLVSQDAALRIVCLCPIVCLNVCVFNSLLIWLCICLSVRPFTCLPLCLCLCVCFSLLMYVCMYAQLIEPHTCKLCVCVSLYMRICMFSLQNHTLANMKCLAIERVHTDDTEKRQEREESFWIRKMRTLFPLGLNMQQ